MGRRRVKKIGIIIVGFDEEGAIIEGEVELDAPRFPLIADRPFRDACLIAFRKIGGDRCHQ